MARGEGRARGSRLRFIEIVLVVARVRRELPAMDVEHAAQAVLYMANLPLNVNVPFMTVMASQMPFMGRG